MTAPTPTPAEIARRLTKAQRFALHVMPQGNDHNSCLTRLELFLDGLQEDRQLTPLGLTVRAELERMEARDG